jgi:hypothetical protein
MHLRHIRPRSVEWYDALLDEVEERTEHFTQEMTLRLRTLLALEQREIQLDRQPANQLK